jgi:hypothetical protein
MWKITILGSNKDKAYRADCFHFATEESALAVEDFGNLSEQRSSSLACALEFVKIMDHLIFVLRLGMAGRLGRIFLCVWILSGSGRAMRWSP